MHRAVGGFLPPRLFSVSRASIPGRIHVDDQMLSSDSPAGLAHYRSDAESALANMDASMAAARRTWHDIESCLDLPCGYGRVTRYLVQCVPARQITACDIDRNAVRFCAAEFGVVPLYSESELSRVAFPRSYDLVFVGSLLTHLEPAHGLRSVEALAATLAPSGLLMFSTQGTSCLQHLDWYGHDFASRRDEFVRGLDAGGAGWVPYPRHRGYGITIHDRAALEARLADALGDSLRLVRFAERGWDAHQDVWTYQRAS
jgi:SAM-dependent methyltransferase